MRVAGAWLSLLLAIAALAPVAAVAQARPPPAAPSSPAEVLRQARQLQEAGRPDAALRTLAAYLARFSRATVGLDFAIIRLEAARAALAAQQPDVARTHLAEATRLVERLRPEPVTRARFQREIARQHERLGDMRQAEPLLRGAVAGLRGSDAVAAADAANALGTVLIELAQPEQAVTALQDSLDLLIAAGIRGEPIVAALVNMTNAYLEAAQIEAARETADRAGIAADADPQLRRAASFALAQVRLRESDLVGAERLLAELTRAEDRSVLRAHALQLLATSRFNRGRHPEAAEAAFAALEAYRATLGESHPAFGRALHTLGIIHVELGTPAVATAFLERAVAVARAAFGADALQAHLSGIELAAIEVRTPSGGASAERRARAALGAMRRASLADRRPEALATVVLGLVAEGRGNLDGAATLYRLAQSILDAARGPHSPDLGFSLVRLGRMFTRAGRYAEAAPPLDRAIALYERVGGAGTVRLADALTARAELRARAGDRRGALDQIRQAHALLADRVAAGESVGGTGEAQQRGARALFAAQAMLLHALRDIDPLALDDAFAASQASLTSRAGEALRRSSFRMMAGNDEQAGLLRAQADAVEGIRQTDALVLQAAAQADGAGQLPRLQALRARQAQQLDAAHAALLGRYPRLAEFLQPRPVTLADLRATLDADEAVLAPVVSEEGTLLWIITRAEARAVALPLNRDAMAALVERIRRTVDLGRWPVPPPFDRDAAQALYAALIAPAEATGALARASHLVIVPDGALQQLPPHLLLTPEGEWLVSRYATSILPSLAGFASARQAGHRGAFAPLPFLGVGNPVFSGYAGPAAATRGLPEAVRGPLASLSELPVTDLELRGLAELLGARESLLLVRGEATERRLAEARPDQFRYLAFATHAVMAGEIPGLTEPAIILTPSGEDAPFEGLLTASDVAAMQLNAELVLLSACNTAAPEAGAYADGLSGLARAFIQAGARRLLVSHWSVNSQAAVLVTITFILAQRAQAAARPAAHLRDAILQLIASRDGAMSHPAYWAPFVLVGT